MDFKNAMIFTEDFRFRLGSFSVDAWRAPGTWTPRAAM